MSAFIFKIIAMITMFLDHLGYAINDGHFSYFNYIGRIAFPIFAFQISEGYIHTQNLKKYFLRLFLFAFISQIPYMIFTSIIPDYGFGLNILFTLFLGLTSIFIYDKCKYKSIGILASVIIGLIAQYSCCDYGIYGIAIIMIFYIFKNNYINASISFLIATSIRYIISIIKNGYDIRYIYLLVCTCISTILLSLYNGKKGKNTKYLLYIFYPVHLLVIYAIFRILI